ncbi:hypothetical protein FHS18_002464 [Paenibacillus phyllosphaerae]|uniref:DUF309 domain-containing protein n=1 Tax=Paenibacillus phyllosphaerae TaxID=274593 RepID=A0A7W5FMT0_9BACL|nr:DUF309 domain-containing protein [Paenibacillus phyllosphaerae]MBB3110397.1 hypothetical protein [Paenibacillus phyllosphaerae]
MRIDGREAGYPEAYRLYLVEFHATRDYFECHELLEEYWKSQPDDPFAQQWVGLIQVAVGSYHHRRGNHSGAVKMFRQARMRLTIEQLETLGLDGIATQAALDERIQAVEQELPFTDLNLPIKDVQLLWACKAKAAEEGYPWGLPSRADQALTERHRLRDRSDVIAARQAAVEAKGRK